MHSVLKEIPTLISNLKKNFISNSRRSKMSSIQCHSSLLVRNGLGGS
jgi:hypothetical protein